MSDTSKPLALVTGASSGIGYELARGLAEDGYDLIIAAEDNELKTVADELREMGAVVHAAQVDLTVPEDVERLATSVGEAGQLGRPLEVAALNAGISINGAFAELPVEDLLRVVDLNVRSTVHLAAFLLPAMLERGQGKMLFTSSIDATMPAPYQAAYAASKAFIYSLAQGIRGEVKDQGVTVTTLMPGPTDTEIFERADMEDTAMAKAPRDSAAKVARAGLDALYAGKDHVIPGVRNKVSATSNQMLPDKLVAAMRAKVSKPGSAPGA